MGAANQSYVQPTTLVELLRRRLEEQPVRIAYTFLRDGEEESSYLTYAELDRQARAIAGLLQEHGASGERVLLLYPPGSAGLEFIAGFFGCLYAGAIATPVYPPRLNSSWSRLEAIITDAQPTLALTTGAIRDRVKDTSPQTPALQTLRWLATDEWKDDWALGRREPVVKGETLAFLQYTSGFTSEPKGVMVSHANVLHNQRLMQRAFRQTADSIVVSWLPLYHDMGLIGGVLHPLFIGGRCVLMAPAAFLQRPIRWLDAISRYRATTSGGPNFAYDLCARKITEAQRETLDLRSWEVAFNGAEQVRAETLERFASVFATCGFRRQAFAPCYGLAEATLLVTGGATGSGPVIESFDADALGRGLAVARSCDDDASQAPTKRLVSSGQSTPEQQVVVVNPESLTRCAEDQVGEIWVAGPSVACGYWNRPTGTEQTFRAIISDGGDGEAGPFLRTGDLGFLRQGQLFVTGRRKDALIIRGRNHYPQDIELTVENCHAALRPGAGAAFTVEAEGAERLVVAHELDPRQAAAPDEVMNAMRQAVAQEHELQIYAIALVKAGSIPKTSSGKIRRQACRADFLAGALSVVKEWRSEAAIGTNADAAPDEFPHSIEEIETWLAAQIALRTGCSRREIDLQRPIIRYGLDSLVAIEIIHLIETRLGARLSNASLLQGESISELAAQIFGQLDDALATASQGDGEALHASTDLPLSAGQQSLYFLHQLAPESAAYNIASAARLRGRGEVDIAALRRAFHRLVERHAALRATFVSRAGRLAQNFGAQSELDFEIEDATDWRDERLRQRIVEAAHQAFDLARGPLLRVRLFIRTPQEHVVLLVAHHIVVDFWSLAVLARELGVIYKAEWQAERTGARLDLPPLASQYSDYVCWQTSLLAQPEGERLREYWRHQLAGASPALNLPLDHLRPPAQTFRGATRSRTLDEQLTGALKVLSRTHNATLFMTLCAAWQTLLGRYTGQEDVLIGAPATGRARAEWANVVGYFANPVVLRARLSGKAPFIEFLAQVRQTVLAALARQDYPFGWLVEDLQPKRDPSQPPLFQVMLVMHKAPPGCGDELALFALGEEGARLQLGELELESLGFEQQSAQLDLTLRVAGV